MSLHHIQITYLTQHDSIRETRRKANPSLLAPHTTQRFNLQTSQISGL